MQIKLELLEEGTEFTFKGRRYKKGYIIWNSTSCINSSLTVNGVQIPNSPVVNAEPFLGGKFQPNIKEWFNLETEVTVE